MKKDVACLLSKRILLKQGQLNNWVKKLLEGNRMKKCVLLVVMCMAFLCLSACSSSQNAVVTPSSIVYAEKQLVFAANDLSKDADANLYIFENGEITFRSNSVIKLGDLAGLSDEEIETKYRDAENENRNKPHNYDNTYYEYLTNPTVSDVTLQTDKSGNEVVSETVQISDYVAQQISNGDVVIVMDGAAWSHSDEIELKEVVEAEPIYDSSFGGFKGNSITFDSPKSKFFLIQVKDSKSTSFSWDEIGAEGTTRS